MASGSQYYLELFKNMPLDKFAEAEGESKYIEIPVPVLTKSCDGKTSDEHINRIMKYIYHNQKFDVIKGELTEDNVSSLLSQAYVMKCVNLIKDLEKLIIHEILNPENAAKFYLDSIYVSPKDTFDSI